MDKIKFGLYEKAMPNGFTLKRKLDTAAEAGFDQLELSVDETDEKLARLGWGLSERKDFVAAQADSHMPVRTMCLSAQRKYPLGSHDKETRKRSTSILTGAVDLAYDTGIRIIQLAGYDVYYEQGDEDTRAYFEENLERCVRYAASSGVILAFETMETDFMNTTEKAMRYVERINSPYLQIYPDIGNVTNGAEDPAADLAAGKGRLAAAHLKETLPGVFRDLRYGEGRVDFPALVPLLYRLGVRIFTCEFWYREGTDCRSELEYALGYMKNVLKG